MGDLLVPAVALVAVLICAFMVFNFFMCRGFGTRADAALRETLLWGGCFAVFAGVDFWMIVPGSGYLLPVT